MLELTGLNVWAMLVVWVIYMAVGAFWYSPAGFAKKWTKLTGIDILKIPENQATKILIAVALSALVQALTLAVVLNSLEVSSITHGVLTGLGLWFGFTAATTVGVTLYSKRNWSFWWLNSAYFLIVMLVGSVILTVWR
jgi:hypothetical protein